MPRTLVGVRFWIHYSVTQLPTPPNHFYFKLFANGENITNWGINPAKDAAGTIAKGLYASDESWHYRDESREVFKREGIESRLFRFASRPGNSSRAEDGGVIEVQVFRAKGRRRCTPRLSQCRIQGERGILYKIPIPSFNPPFGTVLLSSL